MATAAATTTTPTAGDDVKREITAALALVAAPGTFACATQVKAFSTVGRTVPNLAVKFLGRISLPLCKQQADIIKAACLAGNAPWGKSAETAEWTMDPTRVTTADVDNRWASIVADTTRYACVKLGVSGEDLGGITARLSKLVLYGVGGRFKPLVEKDAAGRVPGMFATLVVQLPAHHVGGALVVRNCSSGGGGGGGESGGK
jgi:hypothetical protein